MIGMLAALWVIVTQCIGEIDNVAGGAFVDMEGEDFLTAGFTGTGQTKDLCSDQCPCGNLIKAYITGDGGICDTAAYYGAGGRVLLQDCGKIARAVGGIDGFFHSVDSFPMTIIWSWIRIGEGSQVTCNINGNIAVFVPCEGAAVTVKPLQLLPSCIR